MNYIIANSTALIICIIFFYVYQYIKKYFQRKKDYKEFQEFMKYLKEKERLQNEILYKGVEILLKYHLKINQK